MILFINLYNICEISGQDYEQEFKHVVSTLNWDKDLCLGNTLLSSWKFCRQESHFIYLFLLITVSTCQHWGTLATSPCPSSESQNFLKLTLNTFECNEPYNHIFMLTIKNPLVQHSEVFSSSTFLTSWVGDNGNTFIMKKAGENGLTLA